MILKTDNHTRYNTDDLNAIIDRVRSVRIMLYGYGSSGQTYSGQLDNRVTGVSYVVGSVPEPRRGRISSSGEDAVSWVGNNRLRIVSPNRLSEDANYGLAMLGGAESEVVYAPARLVEQVIEGLLRAGFQNRWMNYGVSLQPLVDRAKNLAVGLQLRIMDRVEAPVEARKPSKEKTIARLKQDNFYGSGGVLEGPRWAWGSGSRAPTGKWRHRVNEAARYYNREWNARNKYRDQLIALGETPREYETFSEYLRRVADEIESANGGAK